MTYTEKAEALTQNLNVSGLLGLVTELCREIDNINAEKIGIKECLNKKPVPSVLKKTK